ncbi:hypothetical protein DXG01_000193 [Tephrocybe rancida]|nr:hypothetical protein DXG01_000193 [Tephrocybe rancida]
MPFPPNAYDSLEEMFTSKPHDFLDQPSIADGDDGRDSYWDAYGLSDDSDDQLGTGRPKVEHDTGTEDAYWAQYSAVHGSGDSARPTPPTVNQRLDSERVILAYPHHRTSSAYNPLAPPSPKALASLLADLPPRTPSPIFDDSDSGFGSASASGSASPPILSSPDINSSDAPSALLSAATYTPLLQVDSGSPVNEHPLAEDLEAQNAVKDTIRGVYRLWRARRVTGSPTFDGDHDEFLGIVRQALS